jgi:hypothetical protein
MNWGRWTFSILSVASIAVDVTGFFSWVPIDRAEIVLMGSDIALAAALYFLWAGNSGRWFQRPGAGAVAEQSTVTRECEGGSSGLLKTRRRRQPRPAPRRGNPRLPY